MPLPVFIRGGDRREWLGRRGASRRSEWGLTKHSWTVVNPVVFMARSKNIHLVNYEITIEQPDDPDLNWSNGVIQVDELLSKKLGRTIRNGNSFRLIGYGATLRGFSGSSDQDVGFAGVLSMQYCPVTAHSVGAHQKLFRAWNRQKKLKSAVGEFVRYDDFEVGWSPAFPLPAGRNSTIRMEGINDASDETITIYGTSIAGSDVTLQEFYNNLNPVNPASENYTGGVIKEPKFSEHFPPQQELTAPTTFSAIVDTATLPDTLAGQVATNDMTWLPSDNHLSHLTGSLFYFFKGVSGDTGAQNPDELKLVITLAYEGWAPLNTAAAMGQKPRRPASTSKKTSKTSSKKSGR